MVKLSAAGQWMGARADELLWVNGSVTQIVGMQISLHLKSIDGNKNQLVATVQQLPWSTSAVAHLCTSGVDVGAQRKELEGA